MRGPSLLVLGCTRASSGMLAGQVLDPFVGLWKITDLYFQHEMPTRFIDLSNLDHLFKGDMALMREWIALYLQESPQYFTQLSISSESGDANALAAAAHDLQPQAHYLGSARMLELLAGIEERALNGDTLGCTHLLKALLPVREAIDDELRSVLNADQDNHKNR